MNEKGSRVSVSLRDIAREIQVSHVTVSLALRDDERISKEMRNRVKQKAEEMGYSQNPMLSSLSHYRERQKKNPQQTRLAWINPTAESMVNHTRKDIRLYWQGAVETARKFGFSLEALQAPDASGEELDLLLQGSNIRGLLYGSFADELPMRWGDFPFENYFVIRIGNASELSVENTVADCKVSNAITAFREVKNQGFERIGYVGCQGADSLSLAGYLSCQWELAEEQRLVPLVLLPEGEQDELERVQEWFSTNKPDAVLTDCSSFHSMLRALQSTDANGVAVASLNIHDVPADAGIDTNPMEVGAAAVRTLVSLLNEYHFGIPAVRSSVRVKGRWVGGALLPSCP